MTPNKLVEAYIAARKQNNAINLKPHKNKGMGCSNCGTCPASKACSFLSYKDGSPDLSTFLANYSKLVYPTLIDKYPELLI